MKKHAGKKYESKNKVRLNGTKLVHLRAKKQWSQAVAAQKAKVSRPTYMNAESGLEIHAANAGKIASLYKVELEELSA